MPGTLRFIAIEGPIGVGKTTLTRALAARLQASTLLEKPADNPFLERFYKNRERYALPTQMTFLFERIDQFRTAAQGQLFNQRIISDFMFEKDALFAQLTLSDEEFVLYRDVYAHLAPQVTAPDCVIYLHANVSTLMQRIALRSIAMESSIYEAYLQYLCDAYEAFFAQYDAAPVIRLDAEEQAPALNEGDMMRLCKQLEQLKNDQQACE